MNHSGTDYWVSRLEQRIEQSRRTRRNAGWAALLAGWLSLTSLLIFPIAFPMLLIWSLSASGMWIMAARHRRLFEEELRKVNPESPALELPGASTPDDQRPADRPDNWD